MNALLPLFHNGEPLILAEVPSFSVGEFRAKIISAVQGGARLTALFGVPDDNARIQLFGVLATSATGTLSALRTEVNKAYPALTVDCPQAHWFEREIAEQWSVEPRGHPWLKPIRFHPSYNSSETAQNELPGVTDFFKVDGDEIHEVAVGPVHAGIIEPGHFRFQCHGERVLHLEISLGYQHRGVEAALAKGPHKRTIHMIEALAGDSSIGHATAYCEAIEGLSRTKVPARALVLRGVALELERLANHAGDLGALAGDVGYLPTAAYCGRIRGDFLNLTAAVCGNRFGRGMIRPGGVSFDVDAKLVDEIARRLDGALNDLESATRLMWDAPSVQARFEETGAITSRACEELGLVGPVARACGVARDVRIDFPSGMFTSVRIPVSKWNTGDVFARAWVRWLEIQRSVAFVREQLASLPESRSIVPVGPLSRSHMVVTLTEGWRGEIVHIGITDDYGRFVTYKIVDPSFRNWMGLALAMRNQQISDFPLCNKSFNLSYCGHDL